MKRLLWLMSSVNDPDGRVAGAMTLSTNQRPVLGLGDQSGAGKLMTMDIVPFIRHDSQRQYLSSPATMGRTHLLQWQTIHEHNAGTIWTLGQAHDTLMTDSCISSSFTGDCYLCSNLHLKCCPSLHWPWILKLIQLLVMVPGPGLGLSLQQHGSALDLRWEFSIFGSDRSSRSAYLRLSIRVIKRERVIKLEPKILCLVESSVCVIMTSSFPNI